MPPSTASIYRAVLFPLALVFVLQGQAQADKVDRLIAQLTKSNKYKVRLSAALNLAKLDDKRAIPAFIKALDDSDKTVRGVSAAALGKLIDAKTKPAYVKEAKRKLGRMANRDPNSFVRKQAQTAYNALEKLDTRSGGSKVYVDLGAMAAKSGSSSDRSKMRKLMRSTTEKTIAKRARGMTTSWSGKRRPSKAQLRSRGMQGYHVDGTLTELETTPKGSATIVSCKISMLVATYPDKSMFGFANAGASVQASSSARDVEYAKQDCVAAVVEDLVKKKIIPTIQTRSGM